MGFFKSVARWFGFGRRDALGDPEAKSAHFIPVDGRSSPKDEGNLPRFKGTGGLDLRASGETRRDRLATAFTPAQPVSDLRRFAGRKDLLERVISAIEDQRMHVVVFGDRGIGKTSLLHVLGILAREARYLVRYASCSEGSTFDDLFRAVARDIPLLYHQDFEPTSLEAEQGRSLFDTFDERPITPAMLSEAFARLVGTKLLIILDEFDRASAPGFRSDVAELIKNLSDRGSRVQLVIGGVAVNLSELIAHIPSIRRNILGVPVGSMEPDELAEIVAHAETVADFRFSAEAHKQLLEMSIGSPYLVGLLGQHAARSTFERQAEVVSIDDLARARQEVASDMRSRLPSQANEQLDWLRASFANDKLKAVALEALANHGRLSSSLGAHIGTIASTVDPAWCDDHGFLAFADEVVAQLIVLSDPQDQVSAH